MSLKNNRLRGYWLKWLPASMQPDSMIERNGHAPVDSDLFPISEWSGEDVFITGFPRSGHTWMQYLTAACVFGINPAFTPDSVVQDLVPDIYFRKYYRRHRPAMVFKSHEMPAPKYRNVVYLIRDGRDVTVSFYHFQQSLWEGHPDYFRKFHPPLSPRPVDWSEHVAAWLENPYGARVHFLRYENLIEDTLGELRKFCAFLNISRPDDFLREAAESCAFHRLQGKHQREDFANKNWPRSEPFFRRGQAGSHRDEMPLAVLEEFERKNGDLLDRLGYPRSCDRVLAESQA